MHGGKEPRPMRIGVMKVCIRQIGGSERRLLERGSAKVFTLQIRAFPRAMSPVDPGAGASPQAAHGTTQEHETDAKKHASERFAEG